MGRLILFPATRDGMRTSVACMWATIYFAVHEMRNIMPSHGKHLPLMLCFVYNILRICLGDPRSMEWKNSKKMSATLAS